MTPEESPREIAARWLTIAARDLRSARVLLAEAAANSAFFSQQAAEKAAKAVLAFHQAPFRKTHDLRELGQLCASLLPELVPKLEACVRLSDYAVTFRYLEAPYEPDAAEAADALARATALFDAIKAELNLP